MKEIGSGIYIETGYQGMTLGALALSRGTILIDAPPCPQDARSWRAALHNLGSGVNRLLINLDSHYDRTLGVRTMDCAVMAHEITAERIRERAAVFKGQNGNTGAAWENCIGLSGIRWTPPDLTYTEISQIHWSGESILLEHHPGPSPGNTWVVLPAAKIVFVGDTVLLNQPPFLATGELDPWIDSVELLLTRRFRDYLIVSSRGGPVPEEIVKWYRTNLKYIRRRMKAFAGRDEPPETTEELVPKLLKKIEYPKKYHPQYAQRLRHGLREYYIQHYRPEEALEEAEKAG